MKIGNGLNWLRIRSIGGLLWGGNETWGSNEDVQFRDQMNDCQLLEEFFR